VKNKGKLLHALNGVWIGDYCILAKAARFDKFAHNDGAVVKPNTVFRKVGVESDEVMISKGKNANVLQKGDAVVTKRGEETNVTVGSVHMPVVGLERKKRVKTMKAGTGEVVGLVKTVGKVRETEEEGDGGGWGQGRFEEKKIAGMSKAFIVSKVIPATKFIPVYQEDRARASSGMVAHIKEGDSALSFQQRIEDAGFPNVIVTPLGG